MAKFDIDPTLGMLEKTKAAPLKFGDIPSGMSSEATADRARTVATLTAAMEPERTADLDGLWRDSVNFVNSSSDPDQAVEDVQRSFAGEQQKALLEVASAKGEFRLQDDSPLQPVDFQQLQEQYQGQKGRTRAETDAIQSFDPDSFDLDEQVRGKAEVTIHGANIIKGLSENEDKFSELTDNIADYAGFMFVPDFNKDLFDLGMSFKDFSRMAVGYQQLDQEDQMEFLEQQLPEWWDKFEGNQVKTMFMLGLLEDPNTTDATALEAGLDATEVADLAFGTGLVRRVARSFSLAGKAANLGARKTAARMSDRASVGDAEGQRMTGSNHVDAVDSVSPYKGEGANGTKTDDISDLLTDEDPAFLEAIQGVRTQMDEVAEDADGFVEDFLTPREAGQARTRAVSELREAAQKQNAKLTNVVVDKGDRKGFSVSAKFNGSPITSRFNYQLDDAGELSINRIDGGLKNLTGKITSAQRVFENFDETFVEDITFAGQQGGRVLDGFKRVATKIDKPLQKKEMRDLDAVMIAGDEKITGRNPKGFVWSPNELRSGVDTAEGITKLNEKQIKAYYERTELFTKLGEIQNQMVRRRLEVSGMKDVQFTTSMPSGVRIRSNVVGRPTTWDNAGTKNGANDFVFDPSKTDKMKFTQFATAQRQKSANQVVEMLKPMYTRVGGKDVAVTHMVIPISGGIRNLPRKVTNIAPGYVPRARKKGMVYVKDMSSPYRSTVRAFDGMKKAQDWAEAQKAIAAEQKLPVPNYQAVRDDELNAVERNLDNLEAVGGLYTSPRKKDPLLMEDDGVTPNRINVGEATNRYMSSIARRMPINEYRMATVRRWENSARAAVKKFGTDTGPTEVNFLSDNIPLPDSGEAGALKKMLENSRDYLHQQFMSQNTNEYRTLEQTMLNLVDFMEGKPFLGKKPRNAALSMAYSDPVAAIKGLTFNATLGMGNIRQLYVQAQNAAISSAIKPQYAPQASVDAIGMTLGMKAYRSGRKDIVRTMGKMLGKDADEFEARMKAFSDSGMYDSIVRNADFDAQEYGIGATSMNSLRKAAELGRGFFRNGELFSRAISWGIATREFRAINGRMPESPSEIRQATDNAYRMHINMSRENAAQWQNNKVLAIPTQFLQARAKFVENALTGLAGKQKANWTRAESSRVLGAQIALYGIIGVPLAQQVYGGLADQFGMSIPELQEQYSDVDEAINEGLTGAITNSFGIDVNMSKSGSLLADINDNFASNLLKAGISTLSGGNDAPPIRDLAGPALSVALRGGDAVTNLANRVMYLVDKRDPAEIPGQLASAASDFAAITSIWSNTRKAAMMYRMQTLVDSKGQTVLGPDALGDMDHWDMIFRSMGFPLDEEVALRKLQEYNWNSEGERRQTLDDLSAAAALARREGNPELFRTIKDVVLEPYSPPERKEIMDTVFERAFGAETTRDRELETFMRSMLKHGRISETPTTQGDL